LVLCPSPNEPNEADVCEDSEDRDRVLIAGVVAGPYALGFIDDLELVEQVGEIGVIFIGLELSGDLIGKMTALMLGGGAALAFLGNAAEGNYHHLLELRRNPRYVRKIAALRCVKFRLSSEAKLNCLRIGRPRSDAERR